LAWTQWVKKPCFSIHYIFLTKENIYILCWGDPVVRPNLSVVKPIHVVLSISISVLATVASDSSAQDIEFVSMFGEFGDQTGQFNRPTAVAVDNLGQIFIAERNNHRFQICDYLGNCAEFGKRGPGQGEFGDPQGIEVDDQGRVLVAETELNNRVQILDQRGNWIDYIYGFVGPAGLTVDSQSRIIVSEVNGNRVQVCSYEGNCSSFGNSGSTLGKFDFPRGVAVDKQGRILVADWGNHRIQICDYQGDCLEFGSFGTQPGQFYNPAGVAVDSLNRIIVADRDNHRIQVCDHLGDCKVYGSFGSGPGEFSRPVGIVVDSKDRIIIAERDNNRVQILQITDTGHDFLINPGLNDAWFNPATTGQGFLITVFENRKEMFLAWFTYDIERPPEDVNAILGDPGHRWLTAQGTYERDKANLTIFVTEGGVFDASEPVADTNAAGDGTMTIEFADCTEGLVEYEITSLGISGQIPIERITPDNVALCETLARP
jgi:DNA-binding beta-propeller fold protein YncE